jgi:hydrogenase expression/formation protein HypD
MKFMDEYRNESVAKNILNEIRRIVTKPWVLMEVCGGQTHTIVKYGLDRMLPEEIELVHGPGCPVCVTSLEMIDKAQAIASRKDVIFCSFGDMLRVPGSKVDLFILKSRGADVRIVYSPIDCLKIAKANPDKNVVFFAIGFETTAPANAMSVWLAKQQGIKNFSILVSHVLVPPSSRPCVCRNGLQRIRTDQRSLSRSDRDYGFRTDRPAGRGFDDCTSTRNRQSRSGKSIQTDCHPRRQQGGAESRESSLRSL